MNSRTKQLVVIVAAVSNVVSLSAADVDWSKALVPRDSTHVGIWKQVGARLPVMPGSRGIYLSHDGTLVWVESSREVKSGRYVRRILELDRNPASGALSNDGTVLEEGQPIPGLRGKTWRFDNTNAPLLSGDARTLWIRVSFPESEMNSKSYDSKGVGDVILELDRDPVTKKFSNVKMPIRAGEHVPGIPGKSWYIVRPPVASLDGTHLWVLLFFRPSEYTPRPARLDREGNPLPGEAEGVRAAMSHHGGVIELKRDPATGKLSSGKEVIADGDEIPGLPGQRWNVQTCPVPSPDGKQLWIVQAVAQRSQVLVLDRDPATGSLSNARTVITNGDPVPGLPEKQWSVHSSPVPAPEGRRLWVPADLDGDHKILELIAPGHPLYGAPSSPEPTMPDHTAGIHTVCFATIMESDAASAQDVMHLSGRGFSVAVNNQPTQLADSMFRDLYRVESPKDLTCYEKATKTIWARTGRSQIVCLTGTGTSEMADDPKYHSKVRLFHLNDLRSCESRDRPN